MYLVFGTAYSNDFFFSKQEPLEVIAYWSLKQIARLDRYNVTVLSTVAHVLGFWHNVLQQCFKQAVTTCSDCPLFLCFCSERQEDWRVYSFL